MRARQRGRGRIDMSPTSPAGERALKPATVTLRNFVLPVRHERRQFAYENARVAAIVPTYRPGAIAARLVRDLVRFNPGLRVYVVDDCSPREEGSEALFEYIRAVSSNVTLLRTPQNKLKAGALNYALAHIAERKATPDVILTLDDDVVIAENTVRNLVTELMSSPDFGAVCSQCRVYNKNTNLLTRLQGLEYLGFNAIRLADEGFIKGPLVMHGMLTAFRASALQEVGGFAEGHLIEDYEVTSRLKALGWSVKSAMNAPAWTVVPDRLSRLWRQRTRWSYGGLTVVTRARSSAAVFQDLLGHSIFISMLIMIGILLMLRGNGDVPAFLAEIVIAISLAQLVLAYLFQLWLMRFYEESDKWDWLLRITLLPEFLYSYLMTAALIGSYVFHSFTVFSRWMRFHFGTLAERFISVGERLFRAVGYTERHWGTRAQNLV